MTDRTKKISLYTTWYDFKKDFERRLGYGLLNWDWLEVKPKAPLPWDDSHMQAAFSAVACLRRQRRYSHECNKLRALVVIIWICAWITFPPDVRHTCFKMRRTQMAKLLPLHNPN